MARTRAVTRRRPTNINFDIRRVAAMKEITYARRTRINDIKIKFLLPQGKNVEVKKKWKCCKANESSQTCNKSSKG